MLQPMSLSRTSAAALLGWLLFALQLFTPAYAADRHALVIGNDSYQNVDPLRNARNDARLLGSTMRGMGFSVTTVENANRNQMWDAIDALKLRIKKGDEVIFFYAGHGVQIGSSPVLLPIDINARSDDQLLREGVSLHSVQDALRTAKFALLVIDACRDNPFPKREGTRSIGESRGLARIEAADGMAVLMSASYGQKSLDRVPNGSANNGLFTHEFVQAIKTPGLDMQAVLRTVRDRVENQAATANNPQRPSIQDETRGSFVFVPGSMVASVRPEPAAETARPAQPTGPSAAEIEQQAWDAAQRSNSEPAFRAYLGEYPQGRFAAAARVSAAGFARPVQPAQPTMPIMPSMVTVSDGPQVRWRLASSFPKTLDKIYGAAQELSRRVKTRTDGRFDISVHAGGELTPPLGVLDGIQSGAVEAAHTFPGYFKEKDTAWAMGSGLPFLLNATSQDQWLTSTEGQIEWGRFMATKDLISFPLGAASGNARIESNEFPLTQAWWCRKEIKTLADLKGLKVRLTTADRSTWERLGVVPQIIPGGEAYTALEKGAIDCAAWFSPYDDAKLGFNQVAPYYVYGRNLRSKTQSMLFVSPKAYQALPPSYRQILAQASAEVDAWLEGTYAADNPAALKSLVSRGAKLNLLPVAITDAAKKAALADAEELAGSNSAFSRLYGSWKRSAAK